MSGLAQHGRLFAAFRKEDTEYRISIRNVSLVLTPVKPCDKDDDDGTIRSVCVRKGGIVIEPTKVDDQSHQWFKYTAEGNDGEAKPFFVLVNKASLSALSHDMQLLRFDPDNMKDYLMWSMFRGNLCVVNNIGVDLDRPGDFNGDKNFSVAEYPNDFNGGKPFSAAVGSEPTNHPNPYPYGFNGDKPSGAAVGDGPTNHPNEYPYKFFAEYPRYGFNGDKPSGAAVGDGPTNHPNEYPYKFFAEYPRYGFNGDKPSGAAVGDGPTNHPNEYLDKFYTEYTYGFNDFNGEYPDGFNGVNAFVSDGPAKHPDGEPYWQRLRKRIELSGIRIFNGGKVYSGKLY